MSKQQWPTERQPWKSEIYLSQELLLLQTVFYVSLLYIHDTGNVRVGVKERRQEIRNADKKMVNDKAWRCIYKKNRETGRVWVGNEGGEQEIISQVRWEADAALTSQSSSSQAPWCVCVRVCVCASVQKGTLWRESSTSDWISWTLAEHSQGEEGKAGKAESITLPHEPVNTSRWQTGWQRECRPNFIKKISL